MKIPETNKTKPGQKSRHTTGILAGFLVIAPLTAILYLFYQLAGLPFVPFDLFDWMTRVLPGPVVTFGIDLMIDLFRFLSINVADAAKGAEQFIAVTTSSSES